MLSPDEIASIQATIRPSLDASITVQRPATTQDVYGSPSGNPTTGATYNVTFSKPSEAQLQPFADIIRSRKSARMSFMPEDDIREGDIISYTGNTWIVQNIDKTESYTYMYDALLVSTQ
jgi:hypothetical protein